LHPKEGEKPQYFGKKHPQQRIPGWNLHIYTTDYGNDDDATPPCLYNSAALAPSFHKKVCYA